jgi:nitroimidazol reductase NimA-like FMN-containing flavoprotein (pyridoxamine 5'-phosphate oxidase superfamily)
MESYQKSEKTTVTRLAKRAVYDREVIHEILDEALICTIAYVKDGQPFQIPTAFNRVGNKLYVHGSVGAGYMRYLAEGDQPVCISVTHLDGLVLARSAFNHSANYRSVVIFSKAQRVTDKEELYTVLENFTNKVQPGRWDDVRKPTENEWKATMLLSFELNEVSAKVRTGPPSDDQEDYGLPVWAGIVPITTQRGAPIADPVLATDIILPDYLK